MAYDCNIREMVNFKSKRQYFDSDTLKLYKNCDNGTIIRFCYMRLGMVIINRKEYIILQNVIKIMFKNDGILTSRKGADIIDVT